MLPEAVPQVEERQRKVAFQIFRGGITVPWDDLFTQAAQYASELGRDQLITISHSEDNNKGVVVVWYWAEADNAKPPLPA